MSEGRRDVNQLELSACYRTSTHLGNNFHSEAVVNFGYVSRARANERSECQCQAGPKTWWNFIEREGVNEDCSCNFATENAEGRREIPEDGVIIESLTCK